MANEIVGLEHLHLHTEQGSLLDGLGRVEEYAKRWAGRGNYLCITDHGMMSAIPKQIKQCEANGLTPVFGCELYVNPLQIQYDDDKEFKAYVKTLDPDQQKLMRKSYHLLAIAYTEQGYQNLVTLSSLAHIKGFYYRPRVNHELLMQYKEGIIFSSCCYAGEIGQAFDRGGEEAGFAMIEKYMAMFGKDFYLEIMLLDFVKQKPYDQFIIKAHLKYGIPLVVTNDCHFCDEKDSLYHRYMLMLQTKRTIKEFEAKVAESGEQDLFEAQDKNLFMKFEEEMNAKYWADYSDILDFDLYTQAKLNTVEICKRAGNVKFDRAMKFPQFPNATAVLKEEVLKGYKKRNLPYTKEYQKRLVEELELISEKDFASYFLVLKTALDEGRRWAKDVLGSASWAIGPGRGSAVGCLVCYLLGITNVNPVKHGLLFSRFLSKFRKDYPDVDVDFLPKVRDHLKNDWAPNHFGSEFVCNIGTYNSYGIKSSLIDTARLFGKDRNEILNLTTRLGLKDEDGHALTWDKAMDEYKELREYCERPENKEMIEAAKKFVGRNKSMGKHAGGIVISSKPISKFVPLVKGKEGEIVSAWTQGLHDQDLEPVGFIKMDWLVIKNLEQINYACKLIKERHGLKGVYALEDDDDFTDDRFIEDAKAIALANEADLKGIFQFDSSGIRSLVGRAGITNFEDLVAITALYRPGPMDSGMHEEYVARKKGEKEYTIHPLLEPILRSTYGVICYQEQCMKIFNAVGEISLQDCYTLVKAISKKNEEYFRDYKVKFIENGIKNLGWTQEEVEALWKQLEAFAGYAFNQSHAVAYTYISFALLVLKAHYPLEFFTAILHFETQEDKIKEYKMDAERHDIKVEALDINKSKVVFDIVDDKIYCGFANVKGIGESVAEKVVANQPYSGISDFLNKYGTDESVIKPLIGLRMFKADGKPEKLYKYYKWYKDLREKLEGRKKRFDAAIEKYKAEEETISKIEDVAQRDHLLADLEKRRERSKTNYYKRPTVDQGVPSLDKFFILPGEEEPEVDPKLLELLDDFTECEMQFYGFIWHHPLMNSPDYEGKRTFDMFRERNQQIDYVEVIIKEATKQHSKKKKDLVYWLLTTEDASGEEGLVQVWKDDWDRFGPELVAGALVKLKIKAPDGGFSRYTLYSPKKWPKWEYDKIVPKDRAFDLRVVPLRKGQMPE